MLKVIAIFIISILLASKSWSFDVKSYMNDKHKVGEARLTYMFWEIYDAELYAPKAKFDNNKPFALKLKYLRKLDGEKIANRSAEEMRKQGFKDEVKLAGWYSQMRNIFPDVKPGNEITGIYSPNKPTKFLLNGKLLGTIKDPEFGKYFFDIWLSKKTSQPVMRKDLLGLKNV